MVKRCGFSVSFQAPFFSNSHRRIIRPPLGLGFKWYLRPQQLSSPKGLNFNADRTLYKFHRSSAPVSDYQGPLENILKQVYQRRCLALVVFGSSSETSALAAATYAKKDGDSLRAPSRKRFKFRIFKAFGSQIFRNAKSPC